MMIGLYKGYEFFVRFLVITRNYAQNPLNLSSGLDLAFLPTRRGIVVGCGEFFLSNLIHPQNLSQYRISFDR